MFTGALAILQMVLGALPIVNNLVTSVTNAFFNAKVQIVAAQTGLEVEKVRDMLQAANVAQHERTASLDIISHSKALLYVVAGFATPLIIYYAKCLIWDKVLALGSTDPINDPLLINMTNAIIWGIFGSGGAAASVSILASAWTKTKGGE